jgi:CRISPR-associated protein Csy1
LVDDLLDELLQMAAGLQTLESGWAADSRCELPRAHMAWLDPKATDAPASDVIDQLAGDFANWLNHQMREPLPLGDAEYLHWRALARDLFMAWDREGLHDFA